MNKRLIILFILLIIVTSNAYALEEKEIFIHDMDCLFTNNTGYNKADLLKEFEKTVYANPENSEEWRIQYSYIGPYKISYPKLTANYRFTVKTDDFTVTHPVQSKEVGIILSREDEQNPEKDRWKLFLDDLQVMKTREKHWHQIRELKEKEGWNARLGDIWQFWPYDEILSFIDRYGYHPSGFLGQYETDQPGTDEMTADNAKTAAEIKLREMTPSFIEKDYDCWTEYLLHSPCWINHKEQSHPAWCFRFYRMKEEVYSCDYLVLVCSLCQQVSVIGDHVESIIDKYSIEYPNTAIYCEYIYLNGITFNNKT